MFSYVKRALELSAHPGARMTSLASMAWQVLPYFTHTSGHARPPRTLYLSINSRCNLHCQMCDVGVEATDSSFYANLCTDGAAELSADRLIALGAEVRAWRPTMAINSTEPLLYRDLLTVVAAYRELGLPVQITTNGLLLPKFAEDFVRLGVDAIWTSLDGPPEVHNTIRGAPVSFENALEGVRLIAEWRERLGVTRPQCHVTYVVSPLNVGHLIPFLEAIADAPFEDVVVAEMNFVTPAMAHIHNAAVGHIATATPTTVGIPDPAALDVATHAAELAEAHRRWPGRVRYLPHLTTEETVRRFYQHPEEFIGASQCHAPWGVAQVIATGDVIPLTRCFNMQLGNITDRPLLDVWNDEPWRAFRRALRTHGAFPACTRCCGVL